MTHENYIVEDEIDLRNLFKTIWDKRKFIVIFTFAITALAIVYAFIKTPIYEVKSVVRIGYLNDTLVENSKVLEKKLRLIFGVDSKTNLMKKDKAIVSNISTVKRVENFLEISTQAFSNELAIKKNKEVVNFLQNEYRYKIDEFILRTNINIKNLEEKIVYIEKVEKVNIEKDIEKIKNQSIPKIDERIKFINNVELKMLDNKLDFNKVKLKQYEKNLIDISKRKSLDNTQNMLMAMQISNTQNLILNIQNQIENLKKEKENLKLVVLKELELQIENYKNENIRKLEIDLNLGISKKIEDLKNKIQLEKLKLTNGSVINSEIVGEIEVSNSPIKPNKKLIVVVAFVIGFILSIFLVFFMQFISSFNNTKEEM